MKQCSLDQIITDCKKNWGSISEKVKPFTVVLLHWNKISEELEEESWINCWEGKFPVVASSQSSMFKRGML